MCMETIGGVPLYILAGGQSQRFGSDKARADVDETPLVVCVANALRPVVSSVTVVAAAAGAYDDLGLATIADREGGLGPMGGLSAALVHREQIGGAGWIALVSCDWVNAGGVWLGPLLDIADGVDTSPSGIAYRGERWEPMPGLYHTAIREVVDKRLATPHRAMWRLLDAIDTRAVVLPKGLGPLRQANTAESLGFYVRSQTDKRN